MILLPNTNLYTTWYDEIKKHITNINLYIQEANGIYTHKIKSTGSSNIFITTMSRNRDKPLLLNINFVIVDECISVQNKNAKWTVQCYKDVVKSKYGVLLLSATFFKTRYDKLFYLLKILGTNIPEQAQYLDTILNTAINANIITSKRLWITNINKHQASDKFYHSYNNIKNTITDKNTKYIELKKYLSSNINWIDIIKKNFEILLSQNKKVVYFAESDNELELLKKANLKNVCYYPNIDKNICCITIYRGSHGINNLIKYNTILLKPVTNDIEIQIKGRLDRGNNEHDTLYLEYILISDTIMELDMVKKDIGNNFYKNHIEVLAMHYEKYL